MAGVSGKKDAVSFFLVIARYLAVMACGGRVYHFQEDYIVRRYICHQVPCQMRKSVSPRVLSGWRRPASRFAGAHLSAFGIRLSANGHFQAGATSVKSTPQNEGREGVKGGGDVMSPTPTMPDQIAWWFVGNSSTIR